MMRHNRDDWVFERIAGFEAEDADGFDADVLVEGGVDDDGVGIVGDGPGENFGGTATGVGDLYERNFDLLKRSVVVEIEAGGRGGGPFVVFFFGGGGLFFCWPPPRPTDVGVPVLPCCGFFPVRSSRGGFL